MINVHEIFIADIGTVYRTVKDETTYKNFNKTGICLLKKDPYSSHKYIDIFSETEYENFHYSYCDCGDNAFNNQLKLSIYVHNNYDKFKKFGPKIEKIAYKIINKKNVSIPELNDLLNVIISDKQIEKPKIWKRKNSIKIYNDLSRKKYKLNPCFGREKELELLTTTLLEKNTSPILTGRSGVGKTSIIYGLNYKIQLNEVPNFLKNKKIIELDMNNLVACKECIEEKVIDLIGKCIKKDYILFIDNMDKLFEYDIIAPLVVTAINRKNLKVIGTSNIENYDKYFTNNCFYKIIVNKPNNEELKTIINGLVDRHYSVNNICFLIDSFADLLIELIHMIENSTNNTKNIDYNQKYIILHLINQIINKIFSHAITNNKSEVTKEDFVYAIENCNLIDDSNKQEYFNYLNEEKGYQLKKNTTPIDHF